jgi:hypothetical protein
MDHRQPPKTAYRFGACLDPWLRYFIFGVLGERLACRYDKPVVDVRLFRYNNGMMDNTATEQRSARTVFVVVMCVVLSPYNARIISSADESGDRCSRSGVW